MLKSREEEIASLHNACDYRAVMESIKSESTRVIRNMAQLLEGEAKILEREQISEVCKLERELMNFQKTTHHDLHLKRERLFSLELEVFRLQIDLKQHEEDAKNVCKKMIQNIVEWNVSEREKVQEKLEFARGLREAKQINIYHPHIDV